MIPSLNTGCFIDPTGVQNDESGEMNPITSFIVGLVNEFSFIQSLPHEYFYKLSFSTAFMAAFRSLSALWHQFLTVSNRSVIL